jgi:ferredoxin-thioredoxin reductase catalytic subunit
MKTLIIILSVFLTASTTVSAQNSTKPSKDEAQKNTYVCPMHPKEMSMKEGKCSKCGMELVNTTKTQNNSAIKGSQASNFIEAKYICKMDGSTSDKPGKCPKCKMEMGKNKAQKASYACPMHPKEMSIKEAECGKCGMKMVKTTK